MRKTKRLLLTVTMVCLPLTLFAGGGGERNTASGSFCGCPYAAGETAKLPMTNMHSLQTMAVMPQDYVHVAMVQHLSPSLDEGEAIVRANPEGKHEQSIGERIMVVAMAGLESMAHTRSKEISIYNTEPYVYPSLISNLG